MRAQLAAGEAGRARDVTSLLLTAWAFAGAGDLRHALDALDRITDPSVAVFRDYHAALIADALGDPVEAGRRFKLAYAKDPTTLRLVDAYGRFLARHNDVAGAKGVYADFSAKTPDHPVVKAALKEIDSGKPVTPVVRNPRTARPRRSMGWAARARARATSWPRWSICGSRWRCGPITISPPSASPTCSPT